jgi:tRNA (mo5U34)-methyltransferase
MSIIRQKRIRVGGFELAAGVEAGRAERIQRSAWWRYLAGPSLRLLGRPAKGQPNGHVRLRQASASSHAPSTRESPEVTALRERVNAMHWYHAIDLGNGIRTPGMVDPSSVVPYCGLPADLTGKRVLDVGTCDGFWAFEMEKRGAAEVVALDLDSLADYDVPRPKRPRIVEDGTGSLEQVGLQQVGDAFRLAQEILGSRVRREVLNVYELSPEKVGMFDVVFCGYLLVHLRDPQTALENLLSVTGEYAVVVEPIATYLEQFDRPLSSFLGTSYLGMWWEHNSAAWKAMIHSAGFDRVEEAGRGSLDFQLGPSHGVVLDTVAWRAFPPKAPGTN